MTEDPAHGLEFFSPLLAVRLPQILLFRKGRVSVNPNLAHADLRAVAALSVAAKPHTQLLSTHKGPQGQEAAAQLHRLYAQIAPDVDRYNEQRGMQLHPAFTSPGPGQQGGATGAGAESQQQGDPASANMSPTLEQFAHVREAQQRRSSMGPLNGQSAGAMAAAVQQQQRQAFSAPASPRPRQPYSSAPSLQQPHYQEQQKFVPGTGSSIATSLFNSGWPSAPLSPLETLLDDVAEGEPIFVPMAQQQGRSQGVSAARMQHDYEQPHGREQSSAAAHGAFAAMSAERMSGAPGPTSLQLFEHKLLQSKWGPMALPLLSAGTHRFPFAPLWHFDLSGQ